MFHNLLGTIEQSRVLSGFAHSQPGFHNLEMKEYNKTLVSARINSIATTFKRSDLAENNYLAHTVTHVTVPLVGAFSLTYHHY